MEITEAQYERIKNALRIQRGHVRLSNLQVLNAVLYVAEQSCKWRGLPKLFGSWHTIYPRMNRRSKNGVLDQVFEKLQSEQIVRIKIEAFALDSTSIKVHPDGTGAQKKRPSSHRQVERRMEHQDSSGRRECLNGHNLRAVARPFARCSRRSRPPGRTEAYAGRLAVVDGSRLRG
jgi:transposase